MSRKRRTKPSDDRPLHRQHGAVARRRRVFFVAVEGESTEPDYLRFLNREFGESQRFMIHPIYKRHGMPPRQVVEAAVERRRADDEPKVDNYWVMFDRDKHVGISDAIRFAQSESVSVAFSHPSFELWLLLHFADVAEQFGGANEVVLERLRKQPGFEGYGRHGKSLNLSRTATLATHQAHAVRRAKRLVDACPSRRCSAGSGHAEDCDPHRRDPSSDVWRLLAKLGIVR